MNIDNVFFHDNRDCKISPRDSNTLGTIIHSKYFTLNNPHTFRSSAESKTCFLLHSSKFL